MNNPIWHCLRLWTIVLSVFCFAVTSLAAPTFAQDGTMSHRRLELPQNSPTAPQDQLARLLQYFQTLKGEAPKPQNSAEQEDPTLSQLKQALGPELGGMLDQLPPNAVKDAMKDPAIRGQVKDMLQQFSKDGTLPDFINRPLPSQKRSSSQPEQPKQAGNQNNQPPPNRGSRPLPLQTTGPRDPQSFEGSKQNAQDRLTDLIEKLRLRQSAPEASGNPSEQNLNESTPKDAGIDQDWGSSLPKGLRESGPSTLNSETPAAKSDWEKRLRELMQKQRDSVRGPADRQRTNGPTKDGTPADAANTPRDPSQSNGRRSPISEPRNDKQTEGVRNSFQQPRSTAPSRSPATRGSEKQADERSSATKPAPSFSDFLDQMQGAPTPDLSDLGVDMSAAAKANQKGSQGKMSGNLLADAMKQMNPEQLREQAKKALQDKGLRNTLKDILKDAKLSAKQEAASGGGPGKLLADVAAATGMEDTVLKALGGMTEELVEIAKDAKFQNGRSGQKSTDHASNGRPKTADTLTDHSVETKDEKSAFRQFTESASNAIKNFSKPPEPNVGGTVSPGLLPELDGGSLSRFLIVALLAIAFIAVLFAGKRLIPKTEIETSEQVLTTLLKQGIRSKQDVIKAFHQFALKPPHEAKNWWTHSRVVETVVHQYPQHSARIQILASLYEQARYFPADTEFTDAQIQQAADAVRTVGVA